MLKKCWSFTVEMFTEFLKRTASLCYFLFFAAFLVVMGVCAFLIPSVVVWFGLKLEQASISIAAENSKKNGGEK